MAAAGIPFGTVKKATATEQIVERLVELIRTHSLHPGDKLPPERELSELLGVSRPSLREALKALQVMNIIDIRQGAGAYVQNLEPERIVEHLDIVFTMDDTLYRDLYDARRSLECAIAKLAARQITEEQLAAIEANIAQAAELVEEEEAFLELDFELHRLILEASQNRILPIFIQSINKLNRMMREKTNRYLRIRQRTLQDHQEILEALRRRDPQWAFAAMERHLTHVENGFLQEK